LAGVAAAGTVYRAIDLNGAHFHSEIVSLPQHLIPMNNAPTGTERSE
jgi:hypothetical protein